MRFERSHLRSLGREIRSLREARHWSLRRLSSNSGVSVAAVQKIEAGASNPSLLTVIAIIEALGASVDQLISGARKPDQIVTVVRGALPPRAATDVVLSATLARARMNCRLISLSARQRRDDIGADGPLFGYVLDGRLGLAFDKQESAELSTGDSFHITGETAAKWSNPLSRRSQILCITERDVSNNATRGGERR